MTQAVEILEQLLSCGVSVSVDRHELVLRPGNKVPSDLIPEVRQCKPELMALLSHAWPPSDAAELTTAWEELGCPEIPLSPGISVSNLRRWFHPITGREHMVGHMEAIRGFIYEGLPIHEVRPGFRIPGFPEDGGRDE